MDDSALANYVPSYGDRIALHNFCKSQKPVSKRKLCLFEKLREKMKLRKENRQKEDEPESSQPRPRRKSQRTIEIGWIHKNERETKQVRAKQGGGTRKVVMESNAGYNDILKEGKNLFFPNGISSKGHESDFKFEVWDFKQNVFSDDVSVGTIYDTVKLPKLRFYIATQPKPLSAEDSSPSLSKQREDTSFEDPDEVIEVSDTQSLSNVSSYSEDHQQVTNSTVTSDFPFASEIHVILPDILPGDTIFLPDQITMEEEIQDNSDPEIAFGPDPGAEFQPDDTLVYQPDTPVTPETKVLYIHYVNCFNDMIEAFSDPDTLTKSLEVRRLLPDNTEEAGSGSGVLRDVYRAFCHEFYDRCTLGTSMKVPFIRHDFKADTWKAIGRILLRGYQDYPTH